MDDNENAGMDLQQIAEVCELNGAFAEAHAVNRRQMEADPEWTTPKYFHAHTIFQGFVNGVISADPWFHGYSVPPNFGLVCDKIAARIQSHWTSEVPQASLIEIEDLFRKRVYEIPECIAWNEVGDPASPIRVISRYSALQSERDFIDIGALLRNAAVWLRDENRRSEAFDKKFEAEHGPLT